MTRWPRATPGLLPGLLTTRQQEHHPGGQRPHTESGWPRGPSGQGHEGSDGLGLVATHPGGCWVGRGGEGLQLCPKEGTQRLWPPRTPFCCFTKIRHHRQLDWRLPTPIKGTQLTDRREMTTLLNLRF